ncbi:transglycosylase SLT domain-containing protein [Paeniroseomonas aquatica]|uniref:Transglycosylase SLT domain-containing protein n=1 Tax=Paeniroseomonas aquatica TaxID=373043 RepID=A0ABT8AAJ6_9PROT|nr:transglycosylase SLT domain-containing protein [Paeniroseomonas aquatica]MDN3566760.1 transglycosylase SLT domain-containing protein [Paeniroseomonas aquatica]
MIPRQGAATSRAALPWRAIGALAALLLAAPAAAQPAADPARDAAWGACRRAIAAAEPASGLPPGLLLAIALVETGRAEGRSGRIEPWPWSWNAGGEGQAEPSREAAIARVEGFLASGRRSVDVGCMQVNLLHHPDAFASPAEGFNPAANIRYAIRFLKELRARTGNWAEAIAQYHSAEAERGGAYHRRVVLARLGTAWAAGGPGPVALTLPAGAGSGGALAGLCAAGLRPVLLIRRGGGGAQPRLGCRRPGRASP